VKAIRADIRALAAGWFRTHLPGLFAGGMMAGECPICEFITLREAIPFPGREERDRATGEWLRLLDIDHDFDAWQAEELPGLKFTWPLLRDTEGRFHAVIAAREDAFPGDRLQGYGGGGRIGYVLYVDEYVRGLLSRWALLGVLTGFERHLNNIRDSATFDPHHRAKPLELLKAFGSHAAHRVDISAASVELRRFSEQKRNFDYEFGIFKPCNPHRYRDEPITLSDALREQIGERSEWLRNIDHSVRDLLMQYGTILGTRENIELQNHMRSHTKVYGVPNRCYNPAHGCDYHCCHQHG
jgi:hypothetical protein